MKRVHRLLALSWADKFILLEALLWLGIARASVLTLPFRWLVRVLRQQSGVTPNADDPATLPTRKRVAWAIAAISKRTPWDSNCLAQALAAKIMLRRRGMASTLYLGVAKAKEGGLDAHAWVRSGNLILTGGYDLSRYAVTATFADKHL